MPNYDNELNPPNLGPDYLPCRGCGVEFFVDDMVEQVCDKCREEIENE